MSVIRKLLLGVVLLILGFAVLPVAFVVGGSGGLVAAGVSVAAVVGGAVLLYRTVRSPGLGIPGGPVLPSQIANPEPDASAFTLPPGVPPESRQALEQAFEMLRSMGLPIDQEQIGRATVMSAGDASSPPGAEPGPAMPDPGPLAGGLDLKL